MTSTILSSELPTHEWQTVTVRGRLHTMRVVWWKLWFLILRDRHGLMQIVIESEDEVNKLNNCLLGSIVYATGLIGSMPKGKFRHEIKNASIRVHRKIDEASPIDISKDDIAAEPETIHDNKVVALRHPRQMNVFSVAANVEKHMRAFFDAHDFTQINSPKIIAFPTEGGSEVFEVKYFDRTCYLAQSPQFYKQMMVPVFERVYEIGHAYRAEKSNTSRHVSEILMLDMEMWFIESLDEVLIMGQEMVKEVITKTRIESEQKLTALGASKPLLADVFPRISVKDLHQLYFEQTGEDVRHELDVIPAEEKFICDYSATHRWSEAIFITDFPWADAKFYHHRNTEKPDVADRADLLFRGVEIATLTRREVGYEAMVRQITERGIDPTNPWLKHYLDAFKYGMPEEWGFGFGIERFVQKLIGLDNVKQCILFPRDTQRVTP